MDWSATFSGYGLLYLLFAIASIGGLLSLVRESKTGRKLPPGPTPLPVIGNLLSLRADKPHRSMAELAKTYGPIMTLKLGQVTQVVISSSTVAKEVLQKQDLAFSSRPVPDALRAHNQHHYSLIWLPAADRWRSLRKILNSNTFSANRLNAWQQLRYQKVQELLAYACKCCQEGVAVDIGRAAFTTSLNVLSNTLFSIDLADPGQDRAREFRHLISSIMEDAGRPNLVDCFPALAPVDPQSIRRRMTSHFGKIIQLLGELIDERLELRKLRGSVEENDVVDILLNIREEDGEEIDRIHIERMCLDLFVAGTDTTSSTIEWAMAELLRQPETLTKAKSELERVIGRAKPIEESDFAKLPYLRAILKETLRIHPPGALLIRKANTDVEVSGYRIPKDTQLLVNIWAIGRDPTTWPNPTSFVPERFLASEIDVWGRDFELIPFGTGRRICLGMTLAMRIMPLVLGSLINSFEWRLEGGIGAEELDMEERFGITLQKAQPLLAVPMHI